MLFRFEYPLYLYALILIPLVIGAYFISRYRGRKQKALLGDVPIIESLAAGEIRWVSILKLVFLCMAIGLLAISWANPQWGTKREKVTRKSTDVIIALDVSNSMLAQDVRPSRLERSKQFAMRLVNALQGDRIGFIVFAHNAYLQMPLTTDYSAAELFIKSANPRQAPTQGTNISSVVDLSERAFLEDDEHRRALILITDGENHDNDASESIAKANEAGWLIFCIGVGTAQGEFIPIEVRGQQDYKRDKSGNPVRTQLNEDLLKQLAEVGGGKYFNLSEESRILPALRSEIEKLEKQEFEQRRFSEFESYFQYFLLPGILLLFLDLILYGRKRN